MVAGDNEQFSPCEPREASGSVTVVDVDVNAPLPAALVCAGDDAIPRSYGRERPWISGACSTSSPDGASISMPR